MTPNWYIYDMLADTLYKHLLEGEIDFKNENINKIYWVVNLSDCSNALKIIAIYLRENNLLNEREINEHFDINLIWDAQ